MDLERGMLLLCIACLFGGWRTDSIFSRKGWFAMKEFSLADFFRCCSPVRSKRSPQFRRSFLNYAIILALLIGVIATQAACDSQDAPEEELVHADIEDDAEVSYVRHRTDLAQVGDMIEFGHFNWIVLDVDGDYAKIMTEHVLVIHYVSFGLATSMQAGMPSYQVEALERYYKGGVFHYIHFPVTWNTSSLRGYLNDEFLNSFDEADRARIRETYVVTYDNPWYVGRGATLHHSYGGENTIDKVFILSVEEILQYFGDSGQFHNRPDDRITWIADEYNSARIATNKEGTPMWWWSRSPGNRTRLMAGVDVAGNIYMAGMYANNYGGGTRPVLWLNLT